VFVVDTNILIYGADMDSPEHARCRALIEQWRSQTTPWYVTWGIVYEFLRVVTHPRVLNRPFSASQAWLFLDALFASPSLRILAETDRHRHVATEVFADVPGISGNLVFDAFQPVSVSRHSRSDNGTPPNNGIQDITSKPQQILMSERSAS